MEELNQLIKLIDKHKRSNPYLGYLNISIGNNLHEPLIKYVQSFGKKVLFCTGNTAMRNLGFIKKYNALFNKYKFDVYHYDNIFPNPTLKQMQEGIFFAKKIKPDFIFALGGGSVIDTAKAISVGMYGNVWDFVEKKANIHHSIPIVASSTTSGTGSQVTPYAVITNTDTLEKKTLKHPLLIPKLSIADVSITRFAPKYIVATTGFDVLCHVAEVYTREDCSETAEEFAKNALMLVRKHLVRSYNNKGVKHKLGMIYADFYAGIALALVGTHAPHAIAHPISARFPLINHGQALAYIMADTIKTQREKKNDVLNNKFIKISQLLGGNGNIVRTIEDYVKCLELNRKLADFSAHDAELVIKDTLGYRRESIRKSPVNLPEEDIASIVYNSLLTSKNG